LQLQCRRQTRGNTRGAAPPIERTQQHGVARPDAAFEAAEEVGVAGLDDAQAVAGLEGANPRVGLALRGRGLGGKRAGGAPSEQACAGQQLPLHAWP
jgi:hypothetical protein